MVSHRTVGLLVLGSQRDEERGEEKRREGTLRWTAKAAFNLAPAASSQLSEGDGVCACVRACACVCQLVRIHTCLCLSIATCCICRSIPAEVNQQASQL